MAHLSTMEKLGSPAPDFTLKNMNPMLGETTVSLGNFNKYPALIFIM